MWFGRVGGVEPVCRNIQDLWPTHLFHNVFQGTRAQINCLRIEHFRKTAAVIIGFRERFPSRNVDASGKRKLVIRGGRPRDGDRRRLLKIPALYRG